MSGHWLKQKWVKQKTCSFSYKYVNIHLLYIFNEHKYLSTSYVPKLQQREDNVNPPKLSRRWKTKVRFALHKKPSTPAALHNDFHRDWPLPPGQEQKNHPASWGWAGLWCGGAGCCCGVRSRGGWSAVLPTSYLPRGCLGHCCGVLSPGLFPTVLNNWR